MVNMEYLCKGCMRKLERPGQVCKVCGYDNSQQEQRSTRCLPQNTVLNGRYLVGRVLDESNLSITYLALDLNMERPAAVREYFPVGLAARDVTTNAENAVQSLTGEQGRFYQEGLCRFEQEGRSLAQFGKPPGIEEIRDCFRENGTAYLVMEYVEGQSLSRYMQWYMQGASIDYGTAAALLEPVIRSLAKLHKCGMLHGDINPDNILVDKDKQATLINFGVSGIGIPGSECSSMVQMIRHEYTPVEQYHRNGKLGAWTDIYALCAILYRMVTGIPPVDSIDRIRYDKLVPAKQIALPEAVPEAVSDVLEKGMKVWPEERYQTMEALGQELEQAVAGGRQQEKRTEKVQRTEEQHQGAEVRQTKVQRRTEGSRNNIKNGPERSGRSRKWQAVLTAALLLAFGVYIVYIGSSERILRERETGGGILTEAESKAAESSKAEITEAEALEAEQAGSEAALRQELMELKDLYSKKSLAETEAVPETVAETIAEAVSDPENRILSEQYPGKTLAVSENYMIALKADGTVAAIGQDSEALRSAEQWTDIVAVDAGEYYIAGLRSDGTIEVAGNGMEEYTQSMEGCVSLTARMTPMVVGLDHEGCPVVAPEVKEYIEYISTWYEDMAKQMNTIMEELSEWTGVTELAFCNSFGIALGLREDGTVMAYGIQGPDSDETVILDWKNVAVISTSDYMIAALNRDGTVSVAKYDSTDKVFDYSAGLSGVYGYSEKQYAEIKNWSDIVAISQGRSHLVGLKADGTVVSAGTNEYGQCDLSEWRNIVAIAAGEDCTAGIRADGTLVFAGREISACGEVSDWTDMVDVAAGVGWTLGVHSDGTVDFVGDDLGKQIDVSDWNNVAAVADGPIGIRKDGTVVTSEYADQRLENWSDITAVAQTNEGVIGLRRDGSVEELRYDDKAIAETAEWNNIISIASDSEGYIGVKSDGTVVTTFNSDELSQWKNVVKVAAAFEVTLGLCSDGTVLIKDDFGYSSTADWTGITDIAASFGLIVGVREDGTVVLDGFVNERILEEVKNWTNIKKIAIGWDHIVGLKTDGTVVAAVRGTSSRKAVREWTNLAV